MFSKVFLVCALAFCLAEARHDSSHEDQEPIVSTEKYVTKYPYQHYYPYNYEPGKEVHDYQPQEYQQYQHPYNYNQFLQQHPFLAKIFQHYYGQPSYIHPVNYDYMHQGQDYQGQYQHQKVPYQYGIYHPYHQGYYQGNQESYQQGYQGYHGYQTPYYQGYHQGYQTPYYQGYQQGYQGPYVHPIVKSNSGYGLHHYPQYDV